MIRRLLAGVVLAAVVTLTSQHPVNAQRHPGAQSAQLAM